MLARIFYLLVGVSQSSQSSLLEQVKDHVSLYCRTKPMLHSFLLPALHLIPFHRDSYVGLPRKVRVRDHIKYSDCIWPQETVSYRPLLEAEKIKLLTKDSKAENYVYISEQTA